MTEQPGGYNQGDHKGEIRSADKDVIIKGTPDLFEKLKDLDNMTDGEIEELFRNSGLSDKFEQVKVKSMATKLPLKNFLRNLGEKK